MTKDIIQLTDLRKRFGESEIIRGVDLGVKRGERHALIGPNGAGKSTLFHLISGLYKPSSGDIRLNGDSIAGLAPHLITRRGLSRSFQITTIFPRLSVYENLRIAAMARHGRRYALFSLASKATVINRDTDELLELVRLTQARDKFAGDLTYSEQRALEIGMAIGPGADVILLDEPMAGMSREETHYMLNLIRDITQGKTLLVVEHDMEVVFSLCDRISVLVYGEVIASGTPEEIRSNGRVQEAYLGEVPA
ncbi:ABC transporter ATP-binding protein [Bosea minatitlanensis]|uniref:ABC transporter ATP-binding protein n=1 Tax=Bosea minatitlanensis TaxID=128782 RepID=A0ABW0F2A8_9HYPH|nr:ABC transporter ATP-binding protein [Bosea minatitlanensis]MCT4491711.1 ABC transporter ATP-binding protein [Bosea minatitlanensis]